MHWGAKEVQFAESFGSWLALRKTCAKPFRRARIGLKLGEKIRPHERGGLDGCFAESSERSAKWMTANKLDWLAKFASSPTYSISIFKMWYLQKILDPANVILQTSQRSGPAKREEIE